MARGTFPAIFSTALALILIVALITCPAHNQTTAEAGDHLRELQAKAIRDGESPVAYWGTVPENYTEWSTHSNRLIPVYTFGTLDAGKGIDLRDYTGAHSPYRSEEAVRSIYGFLPPKTVVPNSEYLDQTNIFDIQRAALAAGKKRIILVIFDGMDWDTTRAAAIYQSRRVAYNSGRGTGLHFQDYTAGGNTQFGFMVTSPYEDGTEFDVNSQTVTKGGFQQGGYDPERGGPNPWTSTSDVPYLIGKPENDPNTHAYTDSSSSATSMTTGIKTYNSAVNVDHTGAPVPTIAHYAQDEGYSVGTVTSVPFCHATPAAAYAHNVFRDDYQDIARDMLGLPSIAHPQKPMSGLDVVIGTGWGATKDDDKKLQGTNYVAGNRGLADADLHAIDVKNGGKYVVAQRTEGVDGGVGLQKGAEEAAKSGNRLFGFYGGKAGHLPFQSADGDFQPGPGRKGESETYSEADLKENPTLTDMTTAALTVLSKNPKGFWLMVEAGDVDWANHDNNLDTSIGAVKSGDTAVKAITDWVEQHSNWSETVLIVTADHGHYMHLVQPEALIPPAKK
jgi:alkaline phosphatase